MQALRLARCVRENKRNEGKEVFDMTKVILVGCNGRMGQMITGLAAEDEEIEIIAGVDIADNRINSYPVFTDIKDCEAKADAIIDFSSSKGIEKVIDYAVDRQIPLVECSTGLSEEQTAYLQEEIGRAHV